MAIPIDVPIDVPRRINPEIQDPVSKSVIYHFRTKDKCIDNYGDTLYKFPYSKGTYWTNFKYSCYNPSGQTDNLEFEIVLITTNMYMYSIFPPKNIKQDMWHNTVWALPSIKATEGGIYFKVKCPDNCEINISLLGFTDLYPNVNNYLLKSPLGTYQYVFSKFEYDNGDPETGSIFNVEGEEYIKEIIDKSCKVGLIDGY